MPQPPILDYWKERVYSEVALMEQRGGRVSDKAIETRLKEHADELWQKPDSYSRELSKKVPSPRSIGRIRKEDWEPKAESDKARYRLFYWPESIERGDIGWEESAAGLELLRLLDENVPDPEYRRPDNRLVKWFWRVSQAAPRASMGRQYVVAHLLWLRENHAFDDLIPLRDVEHYVAHNMTPDYVYADWGRDMAELGEAFPLMEHYISNVFKNWFSPKGAPISPEEVRNGEETR